MSIPIYFNNKALVLTDNEAEVKAFASGDKISYFLDELREEKVHQIIAQMQQREIKGIVCYHPHLQKLLNAFKEEIDVIQAAGGMVLTSEYKVLLIFRRGKWDLPKGKLDEGETLEACAVREVEEETGLKDVHLQKPLLITYHTYYQDNKLILKESHWYLMHTQQQAITPQVEEDIEKGEWVSLNALESYMENTHPSIIDVLRAGREALGINDKNN